MSQILSRHAHFLSLALALLMTTAIHGSLLLGFDAATHPGSASPALLVNLPALTVVAQGG